MNTIDLAIRIESMDEFFRKYEPNPTSIRLFYAGLDSWQQAWIDRMLESAYNLGAEDNY